MSRSSSARPRHLVLYTDPLGSPADGSTRPDPEGPAPANQTGHGPLPLAYQLPTGRLIELSGGPGGCHMTHAVAAIRHAQHHGHPCAWVQLEGGSLFPPDLADSGIDLGALIIVHVPRRACTAGLAKAAEILLRSGGFGMVVVDLWGAPADRHTAWQGRLLGMAREHGSWVMLLSPPAPGGGARGAAGSSLGPLVSLRLSGERRRLSPGRFAVTPRIHKDKSGWLREHPLAEEQRRGPWGLL